MIIIIMFIIYAVIEFVSICNYLRCDMNVNLWLSTLWYHMEALVIIYAQSPY